MEWYDKIAAFYDFFTTLFYKKARKKLIEKLEISNGDRILIIACGTGQNFKLIENKIGSTGEIVALDYSKKMLSIAQKRIEQNKWSNIILINADARELSSAYLTMRTIDSGFDVLIGELAFTVIPDWKKVMKTATLLLNDNAKIGILDWYRKDNDWLTKIVDYLADAKTNRNTIKFAKGLFIKFTITNKFFFNNVYVGIGKNITDKKSTS